MAFIGIVLSAVWQFILSKFGLSDAQKLGRIETEALAQAKLLKEAQDAHNISVATSASNDSDKFLHSHTTR